MITLSDLKYFMTEARKFYPGVRSLQRQWIRKTIMLISNGTHALQTGGWERK